MPRSRLEFGVGTLASVASFALSAVLAATGACFSERQPATGPPSGSSGACTIPVTSPIIGATGAIVAIRNFGFHPQAVTVKAGTTVTWVNCEPTGIDAHTSTSDAGAWDSPFLESGAMYSHTFGETGQFDYHCEPHPFMEGMVIVQ
jgi:plastocyanin